MSDVPLPFPSQDHDRVPSLLPLSPGERTLDQRLGRDQEPEAGVPSSPKPSAVLRTRTAIIS